ncbi:MAG: STAS domain-containing protein [Chitinivibrionales bacterium]|nr:STAS domain-containing protein [Chitinivibrionales bacterium]
MADRPEDGKITMEGFSDFAIEKKDGDLWITLPDSINMDNYQQIESRVESILNADIGRVIIDLGKTKNMYSAGFGLIVRLKKRIDDCKGTLYLVNVSPKTAEGLHGVGLDRIMRVYEQGKSPDFSKDE